MARLSNPLSDLQDFAIEFRDGLIGTQSKASRGMCALVSIPLRAALKVLRGIDTYIVTEGGHTFLVTSDGEYRIDPTIDQFKRAPDMQEKVSVDPQFGCLEEDARLSDLPFIELMEQFKRLYGEPSARDAGAFVARFIYYPLAQRGFFEGRMER